MLRSSRNTLNRDSPGDETMDFGKKVEWGEEVVVVPVWKGEDTLLAASISSVFPASSSSSQLK